MSSTAQAQREPALSALRATKWYPVLICFAFAASKVFFGMLSRSVLNELDFTAYLLLEFLQAAGTVLLLMLLQRLPFGHSIQWNRHALLPCMFPALLYVTSEIAAKYASTFVSSRSVMEQQATLSVLLIEFIVFRKSFSPVTIGSTFLLSVGVLLCDDIFMSTSAAGYLTIVGASLLSAGYMISSAKAMSDANLTPGTTFLHTQVAALPLLTVAALLTGEIQRGFSNLSETENSAIYLSVILITLLGILSNYLFLLCLRHTSALTASVTNDAERVFLTASSVVSLPGGLAQAIWRGLGLALAAAGGFLYSAARAQEWKPPTRARHTLLAQSEAAAHELDLDRPTLAEEGDDAQTDIDAEVEMDKLERELANGSSDGL